MIHKTTSKFWKCYHQLPDKIRDVADKNFALLKDNPSHPSLQFKKVGSFRSARVGSSYRALAVDREYGYLWFWIGPHHEYDKIISG